MSDLESRIQPLLANVERPSRYIDSEFGAVHHPDADYRCALVYPDVYEIGIANQALAILYERINSLPDCVAERAYLPWVDMIQAMRAADIPLFSLESFKPLIDFDLIGITLQYELTYTNILEILDLARIPLRAAERGARHPIVIGGGPCAYNPEPMAEFFDAFVIGEAEEAIGELIAAHRAALSEKASRQTILVMLAGIPGVYVPGIHSPRRQSAGAGSSHREPASDDGPRIRKRIAPVEEFPRSSGCRIVPYMDAVHDRVTVEVMRGCTRGCRFCQAGMVYRPVRERDQDSIVREVAEAIRCTGYDEVSLTSLSTTDHSQIDQIIRRLIRIFKDSGTSISLPSLRADADAVRQSLLTATSGRSTGLTLAPEAGTQRMRDVINKNVTEHSLLEAVERAFLGGKRRVKLYFMIGLPFETDDDIVGIGELVAKVLAKARASTPPQQRGSIIIAVSVSVLVSKAHTPFQWIGQISRSEIVRRQQVLREAMPRKGVDLSWHDADVSTLEAALARGDAGMSKVIERAWANGSLFDTWSERFTLTPWVEAFEHHGTSLDASAQLNFEKDELLPWAHISSGVSDDYLWAEWMRCGEATTTADCSFVSCTGCGVCSSNRPGWSILLAGSRDGLR
ncbi:MAG: TIGR03960 family B12-binding radical SAM protein [Actinobacteria bacterium]|nr:TIGR03960 family B12-binding radical SAM protein [Actinomycetota bacterium]MCL5888283.1 TIGR03960 family B12-binding radical SAM protein [Actinomycetota bacterium]